MFPKWRPRHGADVGKIIPMSEFVFATLMQVLMVQFLT